MQERTSTVESATQAWNDSISKHGLTPIKQSCTVNGLHTELCFLKKENVTVRGAGKGKTSVENSLSASYEALEYYLTSINFRTYPVVIGNIKDICNKYSTLFIRCDQQKIHKLTDTNSQLPWVLFKDLITDHQYAIPLISVDLSYRSKYFESDQTDYEYYNFYSASNGLASGVTYAEAVIHATLELMERDAYSYFLIDTFFLNKPIQLVNKKSLPNDTQQTITKIENAHNDKLIIIKMPSRFGVHAYCVTFFRKKFQNQPRGCGASLDSKTAIERAIFECVQSYNLMHDDFIEKDISYNDLNRYKLVMDALSFPIKSLINNKKYELLNFAANPEKFTSVPKTLEILINKVNQVSSLLINVPYQDESITCVRAIIPLAEEFFLVAHGINITPNNSTLSYIHREYGQEVSLTKLLRGSVNA